MSKEIYPATFEDAIQLGWVPNPYKWRKDPNVDQYLIELQPPPDRHHHSIIERPAPWWLRLLVHEQVTNERLRIQQQLRILIGVERER